MNFNNAVFEAAFGTDKQLPPSDLIEIAFSGRSNVGKSSLLNKLLGRKALARVSATPGKTQTVNFYRLGEIRLADLPGYGYAKVPHSEKARWARMMEAYFSGERRIALCVQLVDMRHPPTKDDLQMLDFLQQSEIPFVIALTKSDKLKPTARAARLAEIEQELAFLPGVRVIPFSAENGEGVPELKAVIAGAVEL